jgi:hypothetical protein
MGERSSGKGFRPASGLLGKAIRRASESRGFAVPRILTHWADIVGADMAAISHPVKMSYGRDGLGATLTLLTTGARAPILQMELPRIRDKVNACFGYNAVSRIAITQSAPDSPAFAEKQQPFRAAERHDIEVPGDIAARVAAVEDGSLRAALEALARNVVSRSGQKEG